MSLNTTTTKCRTCMADCSTYHQLYDYVDDNYKILEMLDDIVPQIQIKADSTFSHLVCQSCVDKLLTGYKFQRLCIETNNRLHGMLGDGVQNPVEVEVDSEKMFDPLTGEESLKMKQELDDNENYECEINPEDIGLTVKSDDEWNVEEDGGGFEDDGGERTDGSDTDSSNEKLSVLKERKLRKTTKGPEPKKKRSKKNRRNLEFPCTVCGKVFDRLFRLKRHGAVHIKIRAFPCDICKYSFAAEKTYEAHMRIHEKGVNETGGSTILHEFQCSHCPKSFEKKASLIQHTQIHTKSKDKTTKKKKKGKKKAKDMAEDNDNNKDEECQLKKEKSESLEQLEENYLTPTGEKETKKAAAEELDEQSNVVIKEEMAIAHQIFGESMEDYEENAEWFNEDEDSDYTEGEDGELDDSIRSEHVKNVDFVDTGIGEIEKPNTRNRRNGNYPCEVCGKIFDRPYRLKRHSSVHSIERPHACEICKYRFATSNLLKIHMMQHESETGGNLSSQSRPDGFKCPDCPRRFEKQASLSAHRQIHTRNASEANYPCTVCQRNFMSVRSLTEHITNKHPEVEKHKCDQCDKTFVLHAHLVEHLNRHKGNKNLVCLICEKEFGYTNTLKEHMRTHSGESPYLCPQCGKTFRSASNLRQHMERHFGLKKYQCPECPSRFNCRSDLIKHTSTHTNAKPHVCDICGSRFTRAYSLQKHKLLHSGERPHKCDQCNMTFAIVYHLRRHMRTHTGEKPYKCKYCDRAYAESGDLTKHLRTHVGENTYMCDQCPKAFKYQSELRQHVSEHYKMAQKLLTHAQKMSDEAHEMEENEHTARSTEHSDPTATLPTHIEENNYMCDQCPMAFTYQSELLQHASEHYKMTEKLLTHSRHMSDGMQQLQDTDHKAVLMSLEHSNPPAPPPPPTVMDLVGGC